MVDIKQVKEHMKVIGADGAPVGTADRIEGDRIKLTKKDSGEGSHKGHHHYVPTALIAVIFAFYNFIAGYEERFLEQKFGEAYTTYKTATGKWMPRVRRAR